MTANKNDVFIQWKRYFISMFLKRFSPGACFENINKKNKKSISLVSIHKHVSATIIEFQRIATFCRVA